MNKLTIALFCVLAVAVTAGDSDACKADLQKASTVFAQIKQDIQALNWTSVEQDIKAAIPFAKTLLTDCENVYIENHQNCLNSARNFSQLVNNVVESQNHQSALFELLSKGPAQLENVVKTCVLERHQVEVEAFHIINPITCINSAKDSLGDFTSFVQACKDHANFDDVNNHVAAVLHRVIAICDACGVPKPTKASGNLNEDACLNDADAIAVIIEQLVQDHHNPETIINGVESIVGKLGSAMADCGVL